MLTIRDLERYQAEAQQRAEELFARWQQQFLGTRGEQPVMTEPQESMEDGDI